MTAPRSRGLLGLALAGMGVVLAASIASTAAAYVDSARLNAGAAGVGNPHEFAVQVLDREGVWQDADTPEAAVVLPVEPEAVVQTSTPVRFRVTMRLEPDSPGGDVTTSLRVPAGCGSECDTLFGRLLFDVSADGTPLATGLSAAQFNALDGRAYRGVVPGAEHLLEISAVLEPDTPFILSGGVTAIGVTFEGITD